MKTVQIIQVSFPAYRHLLEQTISVVPYNGQYLPVSEINKKNKILINGNDCTVLKGITR